LTDQRDSELQQPLFVADPKRRAEAEAFNVLQQYDAGMRLLEAWLDDPGSRRLAPSDLLTLNRVALINVHPLAGTYRAADILIKGSEHSPPSPDKVPREVERFCDYINDNWNGNSALHLAAYALWKINWIHPFPDGNGRTARIISYILLCAKLGYKLPGSKTIPEQIAEDKKPYYKALESADAALSQGRVDVTAMEELLGGYLAGQLVTVHDRAAAPVSRQVEVLPPSAAPPLEVTPRLTTADWPGRIVIMMPPTPETNKNIIERNPTLFTFIFGLILLMVGILLGSYFG
jgi:fido (protein-threonine AMPylation protein)